MKTPIEINILEQGELIEQFADFFDPDAIRVPSYKLRRWTWGEKRTYFELTPDGEVKFYHGITSILKAQMPTPFALIKWIADNGVEGGRELRDEAAAYGTAMHIVFASFLTDGVYDFDRAWGTIPNWKDEWKANLQSDLLAFAAFCQAHQVKPLMIEALLRSERYGFACTVDLVCSMRVGSGANGAILKKDGEGEQIIAVVDFKSGRKGFYDSHAAQAVACLYAYNENGVGPSATRAFNWAPKDWVGSSPTWTLKEQTSFPLAKVENWLENHSIDHDGNFAPKPIRLYEGVVTSDMDMNEAFRDVDVATLIRRKYGLPETAALELMEVS
jgi:hypothetical protein